MYIWSADSDELKRSFRLSKTESNCGLNCCIIQMPKLFQPWSSVITLAMPLHAPLCCRYAYNSTSLRVTCSPSHTISQCGLLLPSSAVAVRLACSHSVLPRAVAGHRRTWRSAVGKLISCKEAFMRRYERLQVSLFRILHFLFHVVTGMADEQNYTIWDLQILLFASN
jgi:hypothetical protein